jgi:hypothetical protein
MSQASEALLSPHSQPCTSTFAGIKAQNGAQEEMCAAVSSKSLKL